MDIIYNQNFSIYYKKEYKQYAESISTKLPAVRDTISQTWGIDTSDKCRVYILDTMYPMIFHPKPLPGKLLMMLTIPIWYGRARRAWDMSAGWTLNNYKGRVFGIKTPREISKAAERNKTGIYTPVYDDVDKRAECTACHEMAHAFTSHLRLPLWLSEGIAQYSADRYAGEPTIREETIMMLNEKPGGVLEEFLSGYWIVRRLEERRTGTVSGILRKGTDYSAGISAALGIPEAGYKEYMRAVRQAT